MTEDHARSLVTYPVGMTALEVQNVIGISEHGRRQLEAEGRLVPVAVGRRRIYPRWQVFNVLGMTDPDVAAAEAAREVSGLGQAEAPSEDDAPVNLVALDRHSQRGTAHG